MSSLTDLFDAHGVDYQLPPHRHVRNGWIGTDCLSCSPGWGKYRLGFEISTGRTHCWHCGGLDGVKIIAELCGISYSVAAKVWGGRDQVDKRDTPGILKVPFGIQDLVDLPLHRKYLISRGFNPEGIAKLWEVGGISISSHLSWRLYIPIHDRYSRVVSWTTRAIAESVTPKYSSAGPADEMKPHKSILYGAQHARHVAIIVEGPLDVWSIGPGAVATTGIGYTEAQLVAMSEYPVRAVCFDADAWKKAEQLCNDLSSYPGSTYMIELETGDDPASANQDEIDDLRERYLSVDLTAV